MTTTKIINRLYRHNGCNHIIKKINNRWLVMAEVTNEIYEVFTSKKDAVRYCDEITEIESWNK